MILASSSEPRTRAPAAGEDRRPFAFDRVPGITANFGQLQPPAALDLFDHPAQRIHVSGQAAGSIRLAPGQAASSAPLRVRIN